MTRPPFLWWWPAVAACCAWLSIAPAWAQQLPVVAGAGQLDLTFLTDDTTSAVQKTPSANFGAQMAVDGDYALISAPHPGSDGHVYLYSFDSSSGWSEETALDDVAKLANRKGFGAAVAMGNGMAAILQRPLSGGTTAVHVFSGARGWALDSSITTTTWPLTNVTSLAISGSTLVLGDTKAVDSKTGAVTGRVAVFVRTPAGWILQASLEGADSAASDAFGTSVALEGDRLVVGAPQASISRTRIRTGACYVFERTKGVWRQTAKLVDAEGEVHQAFGTEVALSESLIMAASPGRYYSNTKGTVLTFQQDVKGVWRLQGLVPVPLADSNPAAPPPQFFGSHISLSKSIAAIGSATGKAATDRSYIYQRRGNRWVQLTPIDGTSSPSAPGGVVAAAGTHCLAGSAEQVTAGGTASGAVQSYEVTSGLAVFDGPSLSSPEITDDPTTNVDLGDIVFGQTVRRTFTLQNLSSSDMEDVSIYGDGADGETLSVPNVTTLTPCGSLTFTVMLSPSSTGSWESDIEFDADGDQSVSSIIHVTANVVDDPEKPVVLSGPRSLLVWKDAPATFSVNVDGTAPFSYQWYKDGLAIAGATEASLQIPAAQAANTGSYKARVTNAAGSVFSPSATLAVYTWMPATALRVNNGNGFALNAPVVGPGVTYRWLFNNAALKDGPVFSGSITNHLKVSMASAAQNGQFSIVLNPGSGQVVAQQWNVTVAQQPQVLNPPGFLGMLNVARVVTDRINCTPAATRFRFSGLPPGIVGDLYTGTISGVPSKPGSYNLSVTPSNAAGNGVTKVFPITVTSIDTRAIGQFRGTIARHEANNGLGGFVQLATAANGRSTGTLTSGSHVVRFNTTLLQSPDGSGYYADVDASRTGVTEKYELLVTLATGALSGTVVTSTFPSPRQVVSGWINPWSASNQALLWSDYCTASISPKNTVTDFTRTPGGTSYTTLGISTLGTVAWAGRMADGSVTTFATMLSPTMTNPGSSDDVQAPVYLLLNSGTGSVLGAVKLSQSDPLKADYHTLTGSLDWYKMAAPAGTKVRSYASGITLHSLVVNGAGYAPPSPGLPVLNLPTTSLNAMLSITGAGFETAAQASLMSTPFTLSGSASASMPLPNTLSRTLVIDRTHGTFSGSFILTDPDKLNPALKVMRSVSFYGVLLTQAGSGAGFVSLPQLPDVFATPPTTVNTSPILSARLALGASR